jgi:hypothetical protein
VIVGCIQVLLRVAVAYFLLAVCETTCHLEVYAASIGGVNVAAAHLAWRATQACFTLLRCMLVLVSSARQVGNQVCSPPRQTTGTTVCTGTAFHRTLSAGSC